MALDLDDTVAHADVAGWVLEALDPADSRTFEEHLRSCDQCQAAVAELEPVAKAPRQSGPGNRATRGPRRPYGCRRAVRRHGGQSARAGEGGRQGKSLVAPAREQPVLAVVGCGSRRRDCGCIHRRAALRVLTAPPLAATISLHALHGQTGSGNAAARHTVGGWSIQLIVQHLPKLRPGQFYECWYVGPNNRPGHPELITAGTFVSSNATLHMWSAADPAKFKIMQITLEQPGDASQRGPVILQGAAKPV